MKKTNNLRIAFYDPYIETMGGGEKYFLTIAEYLQSQGHSIEVIIPQVVQSIDKIRDDIGNRLNVNPEHFKIREFHLDLTDRIAYRLGFYPWFLKDYDLVFYLTCEMPRISPNSRSITIIQFPFDGPVRFRLRQLPRFWRWKMLNRYGASIVYSQFSYEWVKKYWGIEGLIVNPPIDIHAFEASQTKQNTILGVGRFFESDHNKKQLEMVEAFREMVDAGLENWKLVLAGGVTEEHTGYLRRVQQAAEGYPIEIRPNIPFAELRGLYANSKIFWHATGIGEDEQLHPEKSEHFGMTTVEAMSAGCVPVVINKGGQPEIVQHGLNGYLWDNLKQLQSMTFAVIKDSEVLMKVSKAAILRSKEFSKSKFFDKIQVIVQEVIAKD